jgi:hypothetical protein
MEPRSQHSSPTAHSGPVTRPAPTPIYQTLTKTEGARLLVTAQMLGDLLIIGLGIRVILGAVTRSRQQQPADADTAPPSEAGQ